MRDYMYKGVPVSQMKIEDIHLCIQDGFTINDSDGYLDPHTAIYKRLQLELDIRNLGLRLPQ